MLKTHRPVHSKGSLIEFNYLQTIGKSALFTSPCGSLLGVVPEAPHFLADPAFPLAPLADEFEASRRCAALPGALIDCSCVRPSALIVHSPVGDFRSTLHSLSAASSALSFPDPRLALFALSPLAAPRALPSLFADGAKVSSCRFAVPCARQEPPVELPSPGSAWALHTAVIRTQSTDSKQ
jgi:hypothetical protein